MTLLTTKLKLKPMKKLFLLTLTAVSIMTLSGCGGGSNSADQERIAQLEAQIAELQNQKSNTVETESTNVDYSDSYTSSDNSTASSSDNSTASSSSNGQNIIGTYEFTDKINNTWVVKLNSDESATIQLKGSNSPAYGTWSDWRNNGIDVSFWDQQPKVWFPAGEETCYRFNIREDGYIYRSESDAQAKNPRKRLKITKIR